jgi:flagellar hook-length control protein FliK
MTASALNSTAFVPPGPRGPNAAALGLGGVAGFEALLAALTPQPGQPQSDAAAATTTPGLPTPTLANLPAALTDGAASEIDADSASSESLQTETATDADPLIAVEAPVLPVPAPATPVGAAPTSAVDPNAAPAHGRDKAKGSAAAPALLNANPNARLAEKAGLQAETADDDAAFVDAPQMPTPAHGPVATAAPPKAQTAAQPTASLVLPTPNAADAAVDAAAPPIPLAKADADLDVEASAIPTPATDRAASQVSTLGAQTPPRGDVPSPLRSSRAERRGMTEEVAPSADAKPAAGAARPAAAVDPAARAAAAAANAGTEAAAATAETVTAESDSMIDGADAAPAVEARAASHTESSGAPTTQASVRGSPETVANLAAQIVRKLEGRSTRFDVELNPEGLGKVDVRIEIGAQGRMTAALVFDNGQAAQDLKARAAELQRALEQAGFDLTGGLTFDVAHDRGQGRQQQAWQEAQGDLGKSFRGEAFRAALETAGDADVAAQGALRLRRGVNAGLDVRI